MEIVPLSMRSNSLVAALFATLVSLIPAAASSQVLLVGNKGEDSISFVSLAAGSECERLPTGKAPHEIAVSPGGKEAAVVAYGSTTIDIFDVRARQLVRRIDLAPNAGPHGIVWIARNRIAVVFDRSNSLAIVNPHSGKFISIQTGQRGSHMLTLSPNRDRAYVSNILSGTVSVIDLRRAVKVEDIVIGGSPEGIAITRDGKELWVGDDSGPRLRVVDIATEMNLATLPVDSIAIRVAMTPDGRTAIASNFQSGTLNLFDVRRRKALRTITVSGERKAMQVTLAVSQAGKRILVAETGLDTIAEVDLTRGAVLRRLAVGKGGDGLAIAPGNCKAKKEKLP